MMKFQSLLLPLLLTGMAPVHAAIVQYTDRTTFLAALSGGSLTSDFSSLTPGNVGSTTLTVFGANPGAALLIESRNGTNTFAGDELWLSDTGTLDTALGNSTTLTDQLRIGNAGGFFALGADWFLGDIDDNHLAGSVILTFSDNSTFTITSTSQANSFRGFISDSPLTSVRVAAADPANVQGWATIDNIATAVPEPSALLVAGIAGIGAMGIRRRSA
jgi:hypothetical protein